MAAVAYPVTHDRRVTTRSCVRPHPRRVTPSTYARRRAAAAVAFVLLVALAIAAVLGFLGGGPLATPEPSSRSLEPVAAQTYVVQPGDTLWSIARRAQPGGDVRRLVDRLADAHGAGPLQVGERIVLP